MGRMGNHYANESGLNHAVPMIICWEKPGLLGSLVRSTPGARFCTQSLAHFFLLFLPYSAIFSLNFSSVFLHSTPVCVCVRVRVCVALYLELCDIEN